RHVDVTKLNGLGGDSLRNYAGAAAFLNVEIDAGLFEKALFLAVIERRMLAIDIPVEHERHLVGRKGRPGDQHGAQRQDDTCHFTSSLWLALLFSSRHHDVMAL